MLETLERCRRWLGKAVAVPEETSGWVEVPIDGEHLFSGLGPLRLDPAYALRLFVNASMGNRSSRLFAVPRARVDEPAGKGRSPDPRTFLSSPATENPEQAWMAAGGYDFEAMREPEPPGALPCFMDAARGDGSAFSYLLASFLARDGEELQANWHGVVWGTHRLLTASPFWAPERLRKVAVDVLKAAQASPLDEMDFLLTQVPGGEKLRQKRRRKARQGKECALDLGEVFSRLDSSNLRTVRKLVDRYFELLRDHNIASFYQQFDRDPDRDEYADFFPEYEGDFWEIELVPRRREQEWEWPEGPPSSWEPEVRQMGDGVEVTFLTFTKLHEEAIYRHRDVYLRGTYTPQRECTVIGRGGPGYMF